MFVQYTCLKERRREREKEKKERERGREREREREREIESERCKGERVKVLGCKGAKTNITDDRIGARNRK